MPERNGKKLYEILADLCEVPADAVAPIPVFVIRGKREIEISGCTGILEYERDRIVLAIGRDRFTVTGECLLLDGFREKTLTVHGNIAAVSFGEDPSC